MDEPKFREDTDLIDVSDIVTHYDEIEEPPMEESTAKPISEVIPEEKSTSGFLLSSLKDRISAAIIDVMLLYMVYWIMLIIYRSVAFGSPAGPVPASGTHAIVFHSLFLFIAFTYFFIFEAIFYASIGKLICKLSIRDINGKPPGMMSIFLRNLLRLVDIFLCIILVGFVILEKTMWRQRLGDLFGHTIVIKKLKSKQRKYALTIDMIASASGRLLAFLIDTTIFCMFIFGYLLLLTPQEVLGSMILIILLPIVIILYYSILEAFSGASPGKLLLGYSICHEDGSSVDFSSSLIRTLTRIIDTNPFGFLSILISNRNQRMGDTAAGTIVCKVKRELRGLIGAIIVIFMTLGIIFIGLGNRNNFLKSSFQINFLPIFDFHISEQTNHMKGKPGNLVVSEFYFASDEQGGLKQKKPAIFQAGDKIYLMFKINGYSIKADKVWIQEDLLVRYPDESVGLTLENVIDYYEHLTNDAIPIDLSNNIVLPKNALPGRYTVTLTIKDKNSNKQLKEQRFFYVTPSGNAQPDQNQEKTPDNKILLDETIKTPQDKSSNDKPAGPRTIIPVN